MEGEIDPKGEKVQIQVKGPLDRGPPSNSAWVNKKQPDGGRDIYFISNRTVFGRSVYSLVGNEEVVRGRFTLAAVLTSVLQKPVNRRNYGYGQPHTRKWLVRGPVS